MLPTALSLLMLGLYFSGIESLQSVVAPTLPGLHKFTWREFGALEQMQHLMLLAMVALSADTLFRTEERLLRIGCGLICAVFIFVFLEEVDYGTNFYEYVTGDNQPLSSENWNRNLHNRYTETGTEFEYFMKSASDAVLVLAFVIAPFLLRGSRNKTIRLLRPTRWMAATVLLMAAFSVIAHALEDAGLGVIDGASGHLASNVSEFRESNIYYLFLLYIYELRLRVLSRSS